MRDRRALVAIILILLIMLLGLALRLYRLDSQSLWYDEGFSVYLAGMDLAEITTRTADDIQPPLYYYLLHGWIDQLGDDEFGARSLSVLFGTLCVPLLYGLAWQLFRSRLAGLLAALLLAISPLHVWYGQEVRMYTLLTFLCLLSAYLLQIIVSRSVPPSGPDEAKRGAGTGWTLVLLWLAFTLINILALYTHYFAFFVLAFQAVYVFVVYLGAVLAPPKGDGSALDKEGPNPVRLIWGGLLSGFLTILAYLPWLPHLVTRLGADVSYWPGRLKVQEILLDVVIFYAGGESVSETVGILLAIGYALILVLCLVALFSSSRPRAQRPILFLLLYLLVPPALILLLAYAAPKFNARYMMISHPALLLIVAGGLAALWQRRSSRLGNIVRGVIAACCLVFLLAVSAYANWNAYTDPAFARADFRGVARYLSRQMAPDETIILVSGHMFPVFDYYAPDLDRHLLPDIETLDTTQTLDYSIAADLIDWLAGKGGVWLVLWQDEVVDPAGYLPGILDAVGERQTVDRTFPKVDLLHYRLPLGAEYDQGPAIDHPAEYNFGNQLGLLGYTQTGEREVTLFWQALQPLDEDYRVALSLLDTEGQSWGQWDSRPTEYLFPTDRWRAGQVVPGRYDLDLVPGAAPGDYGLEIGVYTEADPIGLDILDQAGAPQGKRAMLGAVRLAVPATTVDQIETPNPTSAPMGGGLSIAGWDLSPAEAQPGDELLLTLVWSVEAKPETDYRLNVYVTDALGSMYDGGAFWPTSAWHPTSIWLPGQAWLGQSSFRLPIQSAPGEASLSAQLVDANGTGLAAPADLGRIQIQTTNREFAPPLPQVPRQANFGGIMGLVGADLDPDPVSPGGVLQITLYWQALLEMDIPYTVFVHLLDADGRVVAAHDGHPVSGARPTTGWVAGEHIADPHQVAIPAELAPGDYVIEVGLYDAGVTTLPRLPVLDDQGRAETDRVIFGPIQVK